MQMAQLDVLNLIDAIWDNGAINEQTIEAWGNEHMRTPYRYEVHRS